MACRMGSATAALRCAGVGMLPAANQRSVGRSISMAIARSTMPLATPTARVANRWKPCPAINLRITANPTKAVAFAMTSACR